MGYAQEKTGDLYDAGGKRGSGGRSSVSGVTTAVFGATGFMGRYVVNKLGQIGTQVLVPYRGDEHDWRHLKLMGDLGQIVPVPFDPRSPESIREVLVDADFVVNLMGVDFPTANWSYEATHVHLAGAVAEQAADVGVEKLVHVSHLNANPDSDSEFLASKGRGELEVLKAFEDATIVKPASIVGDEDRFLNPMGGLAKLLKAIPVVNDGNQLLQPITARTWPQGSSQRSTGPTRLATRTTWPAPTPSPWPSSRTLSLTWSASSPGSSTSQTSLSSTLARSPQSSPTPSSRTTRLPVLSSTKSSPKAPSPWRTSTSLPHPSKSSPSASSVATVLLPTGQSPSTPTTSKKPSFSNKRSFTPPPPTHTTSHPACDG